MEQSNILTLLKSVVLHRQPKAKKLEAIIASSTILIIGFTFARDRITFLVFGIVAVAYSGLGTSFVRYLENIEFFRDKREFRLFVFRSIAIWTLVEFALIMFAYIRFKGDFSSNMF